jgi:hypothetical protein
VVHSYYKEGKEALHRTATENGAKMTQHQDEFCGYADGVIPTMVRCAEAGCHLCAHELDEVDDMDFGIITRLLP